MTNFLLGFSILIIIGLYISIQIVPQQEAWIVETFGKFDKMLSPGFNLIIPFIQKVSYKHILKEQVIDVTAQTAISKDNVSLLIDGVLYIKIIDPIKASYGVSNPYYAISQLAQTTMRSEIGKISLDKTFEERDMLNISIVSDINKASESWGLQALRYEIKDIHPPASVLNAMELQVAAERQKRAQILESEGKKQATINQAEAFRQEMILNSEGAYFDKINKSKGEAEALLKVAEANSKAIEMIANSLAHQHGSEAVSMKVALEYIEAFNQLAKKSNTLIIPQNIADVSSMIAQSMGIFEHIKSNSKKT